jgi:outer membrane lipoprotein carrier protein
MTSALSTRRPLELWSGLIAVLLFALPPATWAQDGAIEEGRTLLRRVQQQYEQADGLRATFRQETRSPFTNGTAAFDGSLLLRGDQYRVETAQQTLVTNGETLWIYSPSENQVIVNQYVNDETIITPNEIFTDYLERYRIEAIRSNERDGTSFTEIDLTADEPDAYYTDVTVRIRQADAILSMVTLNDQNGATTVFQLDDVVLSPNIPEDAFTFQPPPDADVVDLRS